MLNRIAYEIGFHYGFTKALVQAIYATIKRCCHQYKRNRQLLENHDA